MVDVDQDKAAFVRMLNKLLWSANEAEESLHEHEGRTFMSSYLRKGLFKMPMPAMLEDEVKIVGYTKIQEIL